MIEIMKLIIANILTALYQPFWNALLIAVLVMFVWRNYPNALTAIKQWISWFKTEASFRKMFILVFYSANIMYYKVFLDTNIYDGANYSFHNAM